MRKYILLLAGLFAGLVSFSQTNLVLNKLPLQININEGATVTYSFDLVITSVASRNPGVLSWQLSGNTITFKGLVPGRTGLKIVAGSQNYFLGMRVNNNDASPPGLPKYVSIGSVSEDISGDLKFWEDIQSGAKNKAMDIRYIYVNGGPEKGWHSWGPDRPAKFARESLRHGLIPFFVYYNIADDNESYLIDLKHIQDPVYMTAYFKDLNIFLDSVENVMHGELYGIILEPDFLGYMQQNAVPNDPLLIKTSVSATSIATNAGNITTLIKRINKVIQDKRNAGSNIFFGWQQNLWACSSFQGTQGVIRRTDDNTFEAGQYLLKYSAREATTYQMKAGVLTHGADFISIDKYGLDAMGTNASTDPSAVTWFWNNDHWKNYLLYAKTINEVSNKPIILWQLPVGRINQSAYISAYTGAPYANLSNTAGEYEDSSTDFFFGDSINTTNPIRTNYFNQNKWNDSKLIQNGNMVAWGDHIKECKDAGIISAQFGAGVGASTDGIGFPPSDQFFWIQKVQGYYTKGMVPLTQTYPEIHCTSSCPPQIKFMSPIQNGIIYRSNLDTAKLVFSVWDNDGSIASLTATVDGTISLPTSATAIVQQILWVPPTAWGLHTLKISATDNNGLNSIQTLTFTIFKSDDITCGYPVWNSTTTYSVSNTYITYNGLIFKNKYWTTGDMPYMGGSNSPWTLTGICPGETVNTNFNSIPSQELFLIYPNPTNGIIYYKTINENDRGELIITDLKGSILFKEKINENLNEINMQGFGQGIYFIQLQLNHNTYYHKFIKQ